MTFDGHVSEKIACRVEFGARAVSYRRNPNLEDDMKVVMLMMAPEDAHGETAPKEVVQAIGGYAMDLASKGIVTGGQQLRGIGEGFRVEQNGDIGRVIDGPYAEIKELVGGYFEMEVSSMDEARELAAKCPHLKIGPIMVMPVVPRG